MTDDGAIVACRGIGPAHAQVVDRIEHVGLALAVVADEAIQLGRELQPSLGDVLVVEYRNRIERHSAKLLLFAQLLPLKWVIIAIFEA